MSSKGRASHYGPRRKLQEVLDEYPDQQPPRFRKGDRVTFSQQWYDNPRMVAPWPRYGHVLEAECGQVLVLWDSKGPAEHIRRYSEDFIRHVRDHATRTKEEDRERTGRATADH